MSTSSEATQTVATLDEAAEGAPPAKFEDGENADGGVNALLRMALRDDVSVEKLERLMAMKERHEEREARKAYFEARAAFQEACPPILKSKDGLRTKGGTVVSKYAPLDLILTVAGPVLREHGFSWSWNSRTDDGQQHIDCVLTHRLGHSETSTFSAPVQKISSLTSGAQDHAGAATYGRRQSFVMVTGIYTADEDNDGAAAGASEIDPRERQPISEEEVADLKSLMEEVEADEEKFLKYMGRKSLSDIIRLEHPRAVQMLEAKRGQP